MKTVYLFLKDHQDPIWNKSFKHGFMDSKGRVVRSYSEREELQYDRFFDILEGTDAKIEMEQSSTIREYLNRNPERKAQMKKLYENGQIEFLGCGESIIDYNVIHGESIYRNFLYGFKWLEQEFGYYPKLAGAFDTFGLSAQLPQIIRQFGFDWLPQFSRCFSADSVEMQIEGYEGHPHRPFWRGLDGTLLCIKRDFIDDGIDRKLDFYNYQYSPCPECAGQGCRFCSYSGIDIHMFQTGKKMEPILKEFAESDFEKLQLLSESEESVRHADYLDNIKALTEKYGLALEIVTHADILETWVKPYLEKLNNNTVSEDEIDIRAEGNPVSPGSYTTRSVLKSENRVLEHLLISAEKFSAFATKFGLSYPTESYEKIWRKMSLLQFHDTITASHPDGAFHDVMDMVRDIRRRSGKHYLEAAQWIASHINYDKTSGSVAVAVFNPLSWTSGKMEFEVVIPVDHMEDFDGNITGWQGDDAYGVKVISWKRVIIAKEIVYSLKCVASNLPACGYATVNFKPVIDVEAAKYKVFESDAVSKDAEVAGLQRSEQVSVESRSDTDLMEAVSGNSVENDRYSISWDDKHITAIVNKTLGKTIAGSGSLDMIASDDIGCLWCTLKRFDKRMNMNDVCNISISAWQNKAAGTAKIELAGKLDKAIKWDIPEKWETDLIKNGGGFIRKLTDAEVAVEMNRLAWKLEISLGSGAEDIQVSCTVDCDSENMRLIMPVDFGFTTPDDKALYEIPYGYIERRSHSPKHGVHLGPDGTWPAIHWAAAYNSDDDYTCGVLNRGVTAHRFADGVMELVLLRSPRLAPWQTRLESLNRETNPTAKDSSTQIRQFAIVSGKGDIVANRLVHRGYEYNTEAMAISLVDPILGVYRKKIVASSKAADLPAAKSFVSCDSENVIASSIKCAEHSDSLVVRMTEVYGQQAKMTPLALDGQANIASPMERDCQAVNGELEFRAFEIKTIMYK